MKYQHFLIIVLSLFFLVSCDDIDTDKERKELAPIYQTEIDKKIKVIKQNFQENLNDYEEFFLDSTKRDMLKKGCKSSNECQVLNYSINLINQDIADGSNLKFKFQLGSVKNNNSEIPYERIPVILSLVFFKTTNSLMGNSLESIQLPMLYKAKTNITSYNMINIESQLNEKFAVISGIKCPHLFTPDLTGDLENLIKDENLIMSNYAKSLSKENKNSLDCDYKPLTEEQKNKIQKIRPVKTENKNVTAQQKGDVEIFTSGNKNFSYTKIANDGSELPKTAKLGTGAKDWACTKDNNTGLIWEVKTDDGGLRDKDNSYNYTNDSSHVVANCAVDSNDCNLNTYTEMVNNQFNGLCGFNDWRIPAFEELSSLVFCSDGEYSDIIEESICKSNEKGTFNTQYPTINKTYFPNTREGWFWSSNNTFLSNTINLSKSIGFGNGNISRRPSHTLGDIRLVRNDESLADQKVNVSEESISSNVITPKAETAPSQERVIAEFPNSKQAETAKNAISTLNSNDASGENNKNSGVSNNACYDLWYKRNLIFAKNGYCFESNLGKQAFSNFECSTRSPVFSSSEKNTINQIKEKENELNCDINTSLSSANQQSTTPSTLAATGEPSKLIRNLLNFAVDNGGVNHESEIQQIVTQITSAPKSKSGNKKLARGLNDKGHAFLKDEDFDSAIEMFAQAHKADPFDIEIANNLGFSNMKADNLDAAEKYLIETLVLSPARATAWSNLGDVYALKDEENKAIACYANMYRFSKNRVNTHKFIKQVNASEDIDSLKTAREKAIRLANSWFMF